MFRAFSIYTANIIDRYRTAHAQCAVQSVSTSFAICEKYFFSCSDSFQDVTLEVGLNLNSSRKFCHFDIGMFSRYSASSAKHLIKAGSILEMLSRK